MNTLLKETYEYTDREGFIHNTTNQEYLSDVWQTVFHMLDERFGGQIAGNIAGTVQNLVLAEITKKEAL